MTLRKQRQEIYYEFTSSSFEITSPPESSKITLTNLYPILVRPYVPAVIPLGIRIIYGNKGQGFILAGSSQKKVFCHTGLIDPGYRGEIKLIVLNTTKYNVTLFAGELRVSLFSFFFSTPIIYDYDLLNRPQYSDDAGYDLYLQEDLMLFPQASTTVTIDSRVPTTTKFFKPVVFGRSGLATRGVVVDVVKWTHSPLTLKIYNFTDNTLRYSAGTRICQVVFVHRRHFPSKLKHFFTYINLNSKTSFYWANVSFVNCQNDAYRSLVTLPCQEDTDRGYRGDSGFGSSGMR
ncbi:deoxyuridine triphosphatase [Equid gammaherpesvirus 2]|nr:deoxyuridine triphosphatase [Equid gammaherpesvirus 2]